MRFDLEENRDSSRPYLALGQATPDAPLPPPWPRDFHSRYLAFETEISNRPRSPSDPLQEGRIRGLRFSSYIRRCLSIARPVKRRFISEQLLRYNRLSCIR